MRKLCLCLAVASLCVIFTTSSALAQTPAFEVASVKPAEPSPGMTMYYQPGGGLRMTGVTLRYLITTAWDIRDHQLIGAPNWLDTAQFDVTAKPEREIPQTYEGLRTRSLMIQALIVERFRLVWRRETKEMPIYALTIAKNGPKLAPSDAGANGGTSMGSDNIKGNGVKTNALAQMLCAAVGRTVVDQTGLTGNYTFTLRWTPDVIAGPDASQSQRPDRPSLFTAIQEQLGLKLEAGKGPVELIVIDSVQKPSEN